MEKKILLEVIMLIKNALNSFFQWWVKLKLIVFLKKGKKRL